MLADILTVIWKEYRELFQQGSWRGIALSLILPVIVFGIMLPVSMGILWVKSPISVFFWAYLPLLRVLAPAADAFAGERERHTLETLLASPMSDLAILLGKVASIVSYAWVMTLIPLLVGLGAVNFVYGQGELLLYPANIAIGGAVLGMLATTLYTSIYTLFSLRAATVKQANEQLGLATTVLVYLPIVLLPVLPPQLLGLFLRPLMKVDAGQLFFMLAGALILLDVGLLWLVSKRFVRSRLILN
ncbi:ABC transporter permease subunit [Kamptonema sp. UHCC 0994]|uniref:ABC transporter permease n=1 Tax=Kamptonema sp. UHCC 0994 TaxID=3031329 RepID=UPI0023B8F2E2|nr:ABC transporter permease subunit [Kamptonema sp. UHCC 0994]MDF0553220.1 ABC transporter permease subunit [Kamptonema sp. UHCC 0994]